MLGQGQILRHFSAVGRQHLGSDRTDALMAECDKESSLKVDSADKNGILAAYAKLAATPLKMHQSAVEGLDIPKTTSLVKNNLIDEDEQVVASDLQEKFNLCIAPSDDDAAMDQDVWQTSIAEKKIYLLSGASRVLSPSEDREMSEHYRPTAQIEVT